MGTGQISSRSPALPHKCGVPAALECCIYAVKNFVSHPDCGRFNLRRLLICFALGLGLSLSAQTNPPATHHQARENDFVAYAKNSFEEARTRYNKRTRSSED